MPTTAAESRDDAGNARRHDAERVRGVYERIAPLYDLMDGLYEKGWKGRLRAELFACVPRDGRLLDAGVGTGCNVPYYPPGADALGIDASPAMLARARRRASALGRRVVLCEMDLLDLDLADETFDAIACTFVLLCLPDRLQRPALRELRRVLKRDGRLLVLDYRPAPGLWGRLWQKTMTPWIRFAFAGRFDARTDDHIEAAGFRLVERRVRAAGAVHLLVLAP